VLTTLDTRMTKNIVVSAEIFITSIALLLLTLLLIRSFPMDLGRRESLSALAGIVLRLYRS
jgi:hypothetical protein